MTLKRSLVPRKEFPQINSSGMNQMPTEVVAANQISHVSRVPIAFHQLTTLVTAPPTPPVGEEVSVCVTELKSFD